jgi:hypothetical protein
MPLPSTAVTQEQTAQTGKSHHRQRRRLWYGSRPGDRDRTDIAGVRRRANRTIEKCVTTSDQRYLIYIPSHRSHRIELHCAQKRVGPTGTAGDCHIAQSSSIITVATENLNERVWGVIRNIPERQRKVRVGAMATEHIIRVSIGNRLSCRELQNSRPGNLFYLQLQAEVDQLVHAVRRECDVDCPCHSPRHDVVVTTDVDRQFCSGIRCRQAEQNHGQGE